MGRPISQEWLHKRVWKPTLRLIGVAERGSYAARDTFITTAIDSGERPSWVAKACGTSEQMIWEHYKGSVARQEDGSLVGAVLSRAVTGKLSQQTVTARKRLRKIKEL
ncbi:MAG: hypothetical protein P8R42_07295 [Candidatus Binatia bacterium]|nr:hypothetical protein [Candidatus Binatia bacterium]